MQINEHRNQWKYNEKLITWLQSNNCTFYDWLITIAFYTALHKMDELIHQKFPDYDKKNETKSETIGHAYRNKTINKYYKSIFSQYDSLYRMSRKVRYEQRKLNCITEIELKQYLNIWFKTIKPLEPFKTG